MNKSKILAGVGSLLLVVGIYFAIGAFSSSNESKDFTIPDGNHFYRFESDTLIGGGAHGTFTVTSGPAIEVMVLTEAQYNEFYSTGSSQSLATDSGTSGEFSADLPATGKLMIVFFHATSDTSPASAHVDVTLTGISETSLIIMIALFVIGAVIILLGLRMGRKEARRFESEPPSPVATDVTILKK